MRRFLVCVLALAPLALAACGSDGCNLANGPPTLTARWPFQVDHEPRTVAGPRLMQVQQPALYAPSWTAIQAPNACAPAGPPAYYGPAYTTPRQEAPCFRPAGPTGGGVPPESIPALRQPQQ